MLFQDSKTGMYVIKSIIMHMFYLNNVFESQVAGRDTLQNKHE